ncbi:hypothetical protein FB45DRAFT_8982 [Roridomyces roridus]|uniref:Uncharacterized protein n=1 Tax=Roridomyces roridus TaxID=1738132 RepID=A0AAD7CKY9_9AGAR|nr:hypothetical protein FB45DRAFT_8982 [Roridomyces roridus]
MVLVTFSPTFTGLVFTLAVPIPLLAASTPVSPLARSMTTTPLCAHQAMSDLSPDTQSTMDHATMCLQPTRLLGIADVQPSDTFLASIRTALSTGFEGVERELSFSLPPTVPFDRVLDKLDDENAEKQLHTLRITVEGPRLGIRQFMPNPAHEAAGSLLVELRSRLQVLGGDEHPELILVGSAHMPQRWHQGQRG